MILSVCRFESQVATLFAKKESSKIHSFILLFFYPIKINATLRKMSTREMMKQYQLDFYGET